MKKALEAGIKQCVEMREYSRGFSEQYRSYQNILDVLSAMLSALEAEPEKPEPQGSVDWGYLEPIIRFYMDDRKFEVLIKRLKKSQRQWLKTKPAIDPEIKRVYEELRASSYSVRSTASCEKMWNAIKAHVENGGV